MKILDNERGVALVTSLMLTLLCLAISMALLSFILMGTKMGASQKRYRNTLSASYGGVEIATKDIIPRIFKGYSSSGLTSAFSGISMTVPVSNSCLQQKLNLASTSWSACGINATVPDASKEPDFIIRLRGMNDQSYFLVKSKIIDTIPGNSDPSGMDSLDPGMAVAGSVPGISPQHLPSMITLEVEGTQGNNPQEKADLSVLYAY